MEHGVPKAFVASSPLPRMPRMSDADWELQLGVESSGVHPNAQLVVLGRVVWKFRGAGPAGPGGLECPGPFSTGTVTMGSQWVPMSFFCRWASWLVQHD